MAARRSGLVREASCSFRLASSVRIGVKSIKDGIEGLTNVELVCEPCLVVVGVVVVVDLVVGIGVGFVVGFGVGGVGVLDVCIGCVGVGAVDVLELCIGCVGVGAVDVLDVCIGCVGVGAVDFVNVWSDNIGIGGKEPMGLGRGFTKCVTEGIGCGIVGLGVIWCIGAGLLFEVAQVVVVVWVVEFVVVGRLFCLKRPVFTRWVKYFLWGS